MTSSEQQKCIVLGCTTSRKDKIIRLFKFPNNNKIWREKLLEEIRLYCDPNVIVKELETSRIYICEKHFQKSCMVQSKSAGKTTKKELKPGSLPTLNLPPKHYESTKSNLTEAEASVSLKPVQPQQEKVNQQQQQQQQQHDDQQRPNSPQQNRNPEISKESQIKIPQRADLQNSPFSIANYGISPSSQMQVQKETTEQDPCKMLSELMLLAYLDGNSFGKEGLRFLTGVKIVRELYRRFTEKDQIIEALRTSTTQKILAHIEANPGANPTENAKEIKRFIDDFAVKVTLVNDQALS